jgi:RNA polymerase sigma-54 factor
VRVSVKLKFAPNSIADYADSTGANATKDEDNTPLGGNDDEPNWDGDGTTELVPDDGEWGTDAKARTNNLGDGEDTDATELAARRSRCNPICTARH